MGFLSSSYSRAQEMILLYTVTSAVAFLARGGDQVLESWPGTKKEECPRRGSCTDTLEYTVGVVYMQVISAFSLMVAAMVAFKGVQARLCAMGVLICVMTKHLTIDGLVPPPPVMAMTAVVLLTNLLAPEVWGKRTFVGFCLLNAFTFVLNPLMVLTDTFAEITEGSPAFAIGKLCLEVVGLYSFVLGILALAPSPAPICTALAWTSCVPVIMKHIYLDQGGPPLPMIVFYFASIVMCWYEWGWTNLKPAAEKAMAAPMKLHAIIMWAGFVPYFIVEGLGGSFPLIGYKELDTTYKYTPATAHLNLILAVFTAIIAYEEYSLRMQGKMFAAYHWAASCAITFWQVHPSTTPVGRLFWMAPHFFTTWATYIILTLGKDKLL